MGNLNLPTLRAVASAATQGEWRVDANAPWRIFQGAAPFRFENEHTIARTSGTSMRAADNAIHIATFDPPTALALIAELEQARDLMREAVKSLEFLQRGTGRWEEDEDIVRRLRAATEDGDQHG